MELERETEPEREMGTEPEGGGDSGAPAGEVWEVAGAPRTGVRPSVPVVPHNLFNSPNGSKGAEVGGDDRPSVSKGCNHAGEDVDVAEQWWRQMHAGLQSKGPTLFVHVQTLARRPGGCTAKLLEVVRDDPR